jgi:hypothetical protein
MKSSTARPMMRKGARMEAREKYAPASLKKK